MIGKLILCAIPAAGIAFIGWLAYYPTTPAAKAATAAREAQVIADRQPRKTSEANGCEVWAFKPADRWLYFARCDAKTEVVNQWKTCRSVPQGKTQRTECQEHSTAVPQEPKP